jgi:hypothetical protein
MVTCSRKRKVEWHKVTGRKGEKKWVGRVRGFSKQ